MTESDSTERANHWYFTRDDVVHGPFTAGVIGRYLLLGRVTLQDQISSDSKHWTKIKNIPELIPDVMLLDMSVSSAKERFLAAQRWADERTFSIVTNSQADNGSHTGERRKTESSSILRLRQRRSNREPLASASKNIKLLSTMLIASIIIISLAVGLYFLPVKEIIHRIDCGGKPQAGVEWDNCNLMGNNLSRVRMPQSSLHGINFSGGNMAWSDVSHSNLSFAVMSFSNLSNANFESSNMKGTNLRAATLTNTNFKNADLRYSDFTGADITGAIFDGADLSKARWLDGKICAQGSLGSCVL